MFSRLMSAAALAACAFSTATVAADITGAGATFPYPVYAKWADAYKKETGVGLNYPSIDCGASDMPLKPDELDKSGLIQFPTVIGGDVPVVNLKGVAAGEMRLTGPV